MRTIHHILLACECKYLLFSKFHFHIDNQIIMLQFIRKTFAFRAKKNYKKITSVKEILRQSSYSVGDLFFTYNFICRTSPSCIRLGKYVKVCVNRVPLQANTKSYNMFCCKYWQTNLMHWCFWNVLYDILFTYFCQIWIWKVWGIRAMLYTGTLILITIKT